MTIKYFLPKEEVEQGLIKVLNHIKPIINIKG